MRLSPSFETWDELGKWSNCNKNAPLNMPESAGKPKNTTTTTKSNKYNKKEQKKRPRHCPGKRRKV